MQPASDGEVTTLKQHFTSTRPILSADLGNEMRATWSSRPHTAFMGRSVKVMSNGAISSDSERQRYITGLMAKSHVMLH